MVCKDTCICTCSYIKCSGCKQKKEWRQVIGKILSDIIIGLVEKVQETSSDTGMHNRGITVPHEW